MLSFRRPRVHSSRGRLGQARAEGSAEASRLAEAVANEVARAKATNDGGNGARAWANEALAASSSLADKALVGAWDSACNRTCFGSAWLQNHLDTLDGAPRKIRGLINQVDEVENFRFGSGGAMPSRKRWRAPAFVCGKVVCVWISVVDFPCWGCCWAEIIHLDAVEALIKRGVNAGHLALRLIPDTWPELGKKFRWRRLGPDGVLEFPLRCRLWAEQLMRARHRGQAPAPLHDRNVTGFFATWRACFCLSYCSLRRGSSQRAICIV